MTPVTIHPDLNCESNMGRNWIQFPRMLNALIHTHNIDMSALAEYLDLSLTQTYGIFRRADEVHESNTRSK